LSRRWVRETFEYDALGSIERFSELENWMDNHLVYDDPNILIPSAQNATASFSGLLLLGPISLRQQKSFIKSQSLDIVAGTSVFLDRIPPRYSRDNEDKNYYASGTFTSITTDPDFASNCSGVFDESTNNPWIYEPTKHRRMDTTKFGTIGPGGFVALLLRDGLDQKRLDCLKITNWIDEHSRVLVIDIPLFNMNTGTFISLHIPCTFGASG
jgi:hypothetical protein